MPVVLNLVAAVAAQEHVVTDLVPCVTFADPDRPAPACAPLVLGTSLSVPGTPSHVAPVGAVMYAQVEAATTALVDQDIEVDHATDGTAPAKLSHAAAQAAPAEALAAFAGMQGAASDPAENDLAAVEAARDTSPAAAQTESTECVPRPPMPRGWPMPVRSAPSPATPRARWPFTCHPLPSPPLLCVPPPPSGFIVLFTESALREQISDDT
jgi:hypothetical protein